MHTYGGLEIPVSTAGSAQDGDDPVGDQPLKLLGSYLRAVLNRFGADAWNKIYPGRASSVVRVVHLHDPADFVFNDKDLPALFLWRAKGTLEDRGYQFREAATTIKFLWVAPPDAGDKMTIRAPFIPVVGQLIDFALERGVDSSWYTATGCEDPWAATVPADPDSLSLPRATVAVPSTPPLDGVLGSAPFTPRRGLTVTTSVATGAYNVADAIGVDVVDLFGRAMTLTRSLTAVNGGETLSFGTDVSQVTAIRVPAMATTAGSLQFGTALRTGRGTPIRTAMRCSDIALKTYQREKLKIDVLDTDGRSDRDLTYYGLSGEIACTELLSFDAAIDAEPWRETPDGQGIGVSIDVTNGGFHTVAELPDHEAIP